MVPDIPANTPTDATSATATHDRTTRPAGASPSGRPTRAGNPSTASSTAGATTTASASTVDSVAMSDIGSPWNDECPTSAPPMTKEDSACLPFVIGGALVGHSSFAPLDLRELQEVAPPAVPVE